jgi:hypothetical protein
MKNIQPISSWSDGKSVIATKLDVISEYDDLATTAVFTYTLLTTDLLTVATGKLTISGEEYLIWGSTADINLAAYQWVASQLNLEIDYTTTTTTTTEEPATTTTTTSTTTVEEPEIIVTEEPIIEETTTTTTTTFVEL